jgi:DNA-binding transcriptional ArsR family regulator
VDDLIDSPHEADEELDIGKIFEILKNKRRRRVIEFLNEQEDEKTTLSVLAEHIAAEENDVDVSQITSSQRKRVYIGLYQCHLPKMDKYGIIDYQQNRGTIELRDVSQIDRYLEEPNQPNSRLKLLTAVAVSAIVATGVAGLGPLSLVPVVGWTVLSIVALLAAAAI